MILKQIAVAVGIATMIPVLAQEYKIPQNTHSDNFTMKKIDRSGTYDFASRCFMPPRKVLVATVMEWCSGDFEERVSKVMNCLDAVEREAAAKFPGRRLDLVALPEHALQKVHSGSARERALPLDKSLTERFGQRARELGCYLLLPLMLDEGDAGLSNAVVVFDRNGLVAGIYRKVFPVNDPAGGLEGGVTPGSEFPVFECDFGRIGILICWDMSFPEAWETLAKNGAELVVLSSASPQTIRPSAAAMQHRYYVVTSTPTNNVSLFSPIGTLLAQREKPGPLLAEVDLSFSILHWSDALRCGEAFREKYGDRIGYHYSHREDTGIFWSNDPNLTIGEAGKSLGLVEMNFQIETGRLLQDKARGGQPKTGK
jgi:predicted amidohydrolase